MAEKTEKKYVITNHRSGKVLASCGGSAVQMTANGGETQVWCAVPAEGTSVQLVHKASGLVLTVPGEAENGTALVLAEAQGNASQLWKLTTTVKGCRRITHVASGKVVDIKDISDADGAPAQLWEFVKGDNQNWVLTEVEKEKKAPAKCAAKAAKPEVKAEVKAEAKPAAKTTKAAAKTTKTAKKTKYVRLAESRTQTGQRLSFLPDIILKSVIIPKFSQNRLAPPVNS